MIRTPEQLCKILGELKVIRQTWESHWQEIADYVVPRKNDVNNFKSPGDKRNLQIFDNTGMISNEVLTGMLHGMLINPSSEFFELTTGDQTLDQKHEVRTWLQDTTSRMHQIMNNSNFQTEAFEYLLDLCSFGTASQTILDDDVKTVFFQTHFLKQLYILEDYRGVVTEQYLVEDCSARNIVKEFGIKNVPDYIKAAFENKPEEKFEKIQVIYPVDMDAPIKKKNFRFPVVSQHILTKDKIELRLSGFEESPWTTSRWSKASGETYGRSPAMNALPEIKMVNMMEEVSIKGAQLTIGPPVQMPDDGYGKLKVRPYGVSYYRAGSKDRIEPIFGDTRIDYAFEIMNAHRQRIKEAFYVDQVQLPKIDRATREEMLMRRDEGGRFLGPLLARLDVEWLNPLVDRVFGICYRRNKFLPIPRELNVKGGKKLSARFSSAISKIQRSGEIRGIMEFLNSIAPIAQIDPRVLHYLHADNTIKGLAEKFSYPQKYLRGDDEVEEMRAAEAKAAQERQAQAQEMHTAEVANKVAPAAAVVQQAQIPQE